MTEKELKQTKKIISELMTEKELKQTKKIILELTREEYIRIISSLKYELEYCKRVNSITHNSDELVEPLKSGITKIENAWYK